MLTGGSTWRNKPCIYLAISMLEARAHHQLKHLYREQSFLWPHNLTLSRLVARSLRRRDNSLIHLNLDSQNFWWLGLLVPLCLEPSNAVLVLSAKYRQRLLKVELPRLREKGLNLPFWEAAEPPKGKQVWLLDHQGLIKGLQNGNLKSKHLIVPEAELLSEYLRNILAVQIGSEDWELLRRAHPKAESSLIHLHERLTRKCFSQATRADDHVRIDSSDIVAVQALISLLGPSPAPWEMFLNCESKSWASWAELDHKTLSWRWQLMPLQPLAILKALLCKRSILFLTHSAQKTCLLSELGLAKFSVDVELTLGDAPLQEPISLFVPPRQPLPNSQIYSTHLLDQCRRLILGRSGVTIVLVDDQQLRLQLTSELAAEFGTRVVQEVTSPASNGVITCHWSWWLTHQAQLPPPDQLIIALLPLASLETPLMAARVEALKRDGHDWFRELLLPEALNILSRAVPPVRASQGRLAILDGRVRSRSWGSDVLKTLEPWIPLQSLLPN